MAILFGIGFLAWSASPTLQAVQPGFSFTIACTSTVATFLQEDPAETENQTLEEDDKDQTIRERTIYIPFDKLRKVFEGDERKVVLSYKEFNELWNAARKNAEAADPPEKRTGALIAQAESRAEIGDSVVKVNATLKIELLSKGWHDVPLGLKNSAIQSAKIGGEDARIVFDNQKGYALVVKNEQAQPRSLELKLSYARAFVKSVGQSAVSFQAPPAPVNRWQIRIPQPRVKIDIEPLIAVTDPAKSGGEEATDYDPEKESLVHAFLGVAPVVTLKWNPKSEGAAGLDAIVSAQTIQQVTIDKNVQRTQVQINYEISRAELDAFQIEVPLDQKVTNVFNENVKKWNVETKDSKQLVKVELFAPSQGNQYLALELEKLTEEALKQDFASPLVNALDASRQQGVVVVKLADGLRGVSKNRLGLLQLDQSELPGQLGRTNWDLAFRYASLPYQLDLSIEKILPRIVTEQLVETDLAPEKLTSTSQIVMDIQQAGIFRTGVKIPDGYEVRSIAGFNDKARGINPVAVSEFRRDENDNTLWLVDFSRKAIGKIGMQVSIEKTLTDPNLLAPTGDTSQLDLPIPIPVDDAIEYSAGSLVVYGPESLRINPELESGLQQATPARALENFNSRGTRIAQARPVIAYTFVGDQAELKVNVLRRRPQVTVRQLLITKVESGVVKYEARFFYDVLYSGVKSLRIDLPAGVAENARNVTDGITESELEATDVDDGYVAWSFSGDAELFGDQSIHLTWEEKISELEIGKSLDIEIPRLVPKDVDRTEGQIVTSKSDTIDIQPIDGVEGLVPVDPKVDLMPEANVADAAAAYEFVDQWKLAIRATRYDVEDVKLTNVEAGLVQMVQLRQSGLNVRALFRIRSAVQRLGMRLPPGVDPKEAFDSQPVRINGNPINLEIGNEDELFIPLTNIQTDESFLLDIRYKVPADAAQLVLPTFSGEPAMQKVYLCVYVPQEQAVVGSFGPWTNELLKDKTPGQILFEGSLNEFYTEQQIRERVDRIQAEIKTGVGSIANAPEFKTDGRSFLFSALRPDPEQELKMVAVSRRWISVLLIGAVALIGIPLYRRPVTWQLSSLFLILAAVVLCGVFFPMLARQLLNSVLFIGIGLVILVWVIGHVVNLSIYAKRVVHDRTPQPAFESVAAEETGNVPESSTSGATSAGSENTGDSAAGEQSGEEAGR